ncbi:MAG: hypothetical protein LBS43_11935 [Prevotellaceae bacterium]|jgi:hypothetical protein|nr:hypothetical protein [Prevotellaceae bacterium]
MNSRIGKYIWEWTYALLWCLLLLSATFPSIFLDNDFSFLNMPEGTTMRGISKAYMYAVIMIVVIHLLDVVYLVTSTNMTYKKIKKGFIQTLISIMLIAVSLAFVSSLDSYTARMFWFIVFWIILFSYKVSCVQMIEDTSDMMEEIRIE